MARKKRNGMAKLQPAVQTMIINTPPVEVGQTGEFTLDLSQCASLMNRRFYRQGIVWAVAGIKLITAKDATIAVKKIPNTWVASNAWEKAFRAWQRQQNEALEAAGGQSMKAAFNDFKVHMDVPHRQATFAANLRPIQFDSAGVHTYTGGTWEASKIVLPNVNPDSTGSDIEPAERFLHMVGVNVFGASSRGIIEGYADSRSVPQSPDPVGPDIGDTDNWLARMFDKGNEMEEVLDNATLRNDTLPYPQDDYPNGETYVPSLEIHDFSLVTNTSIGGMTQLKGGTFPCGLMRFDITNTSTTNNVSYSLQIDLVPGEHRGYLCSPMTEM